MADSNLRVLVVIPTLNEALHIEAVVESISAEPPTPFLKTVVVDGGSSDLTCAIVTALAARHRSLHLIHNSRRIQSAAINLVARRFGHEADVLVRCDAHAIYPPGFVGRLLRTLERTGADAVVVPLDSLGVTPAAASDCLGLELRDWHRRRSASGWQIQRLRRPRPPCRVSHGHLQKGRWLRRNLQPQRRRRVRLPSARAGRKALSRRGGASWLSPTRGTEITLYPVLSVRRRPFADRAASSTFASGTPTCGAPCISLPARPRLS